MAVPAVLPVGSCVTVAARPTRISVLVRPGWLTGGFCAPAPEAPIAPASAIVVSSANERPTLDQKRDIRDPPRRPRLPAAGMPRRSDVDVNEDNRAWRCPSPATPTSTPGPGDPPPRLPAAALRRRSDTGVTVRLS